MDTYYVLYNEKAGNKKDVEDVAYLQYVLDGEMKYIDITKITDYGVFLAGLGKGDHIVICGGDGTLNRFINHTDGISFGGEILYFPNGTGNDLARELGYEKGDNPFPINSYLQDLPYVYVNGRKYRFINGVGYGVDGYCCEVGDKIKETSDKEVNYTAIAIKGVLFHYKPTKAKVTVDGKIHTYDKVWIAPTMNGKYYGGGMMPTPMQDRNSKDKELSVMIFHGTGKLKTLMIFPSIFKGKHIKHKEAVEIMTGHEITVEFDRPVSLQIDGETILNVTSYTAKAASRT